MRTLVGLLVVLGLTGLVAGQGKEKDKAGKGGKDVPKTKAKLVKLEAKKSILIVEISGKDRELTVGKDTKVYGPKGGSATLKDDRLKAGAELGLVLDGKMVKEIWLPYRKSPPKEKDKGKPKEKDKGGTTNLFHSLPFTSRIDPRPA